MNTDDQQLIDRCRAGDVEAFGGLVARYQDRLYGTLVRMLGSTHEASDVAQDAFVLAFQKLDTFRGDSAFYSWLFRIAHNAAASRRRKRRVARTSVEAVREQTGQEPTDHRPSADPSHALQSQERSELVRQALDELAEDHRAVLVMKEMENLRYEQIAELLDCPVGTVRSRIHRARNELREKLNRALKAEQ
ncbi:MAG: sigma-70 family RNA polymerase sigma factor [Maioricimonas sp. JB049]